MQKARRDQAPQLMVIQHRDRNKPAHGQDKAPHRVLIEKRAQVGDECQDVDGDKRVESAHRGERQS